MSLPIGVAFDEVKVRSQRRSGIRGDPEASARELRAARPTRYAAESWQLTSFTQP
ncbi:hypothetical protein [Agromyces protaetiae]|uniref:hypothetical protein n=1 Tax=Agromyces protaetiae TaxID=2509455 RepID=UPI0013EB0629|nr:hypothetical protein [Agromyces protaetiae]